MHTIHDVLDAAAAEHNIAPVTILSYVDLPAKALVAVTCKGKVCPTAQLATTRRYSLC